MDPSDIQLDDRLDDLEGLLDQPETPAQFSLPANVFLRRQAKSIDKANRSGIKKLIRPENAQEVIKHLPGRDERTHCLLRGDFVLCDLIPAIIAARGRCDRLHVATLGLSTANAETLARLRAQNLVGAIHLVCSHYFAQVDKATTYLQITTRLQGLATIVTTRCHAKVIVLPTAADDHFVIEGSANLRSSDNTEQLVIFNDPETAEWHRNWMEQIE
jgi:hypothetical protein